MNCLSFCLVFCCLSLCLSVCLSGIIFRFFNSRYFLWALALKVMPNFNWGTRVNLTSPGTCDSCWPLLTSEMNSWSCYMEKQTFTQLLHGETYIHSAAAGRNRKTLSWFKEKQKDTQLKLLQGETDTQLLQGEWYIHLYSAGGNTDIQLLQGEKDIHSSAAGRNRHSAGAAAGRNRQSLICCREKQTVTQLLQGETDIHSLAAGRNRQTLSSCREKQTHT